MKLHRLAHHVGHLIISSVVDAPHGVQDASLHRLQPVVDVRHGPLQDHVRGIIQKPALIHARQVAHTVRAPATGQHIASTRGLCGVRFHCLVRQSIVVAFVFCFHIDGDSICLTYAPFPSAAGKSRRICPPLWREMAAIRVGAEILHKSVCRSRFTLESLQRRDAPNP